MSSSPLVSLSSASSWDRGASAYQSLAVFTARFATFSAKKLVEHAVNLFEIHGVKKLICLDLASGTGATIWEFLKYWQQHTRLQTAEIQLDIRATDIANNMLELLKASIPPSLPHGISSISCSLLNMEALDEFVQLTPKSSVFLLNCCFGIMFPKKTQEAFNNIYEILAPNGVAAIVTWHYTPVLEILEQIARAEKKIGENERLPAAADLLKFGDEGTVRNYLRKAGFQDAEVSVHFESLEHVLHINSLLQFFKASPAFSQFIQDESVAEKIMNERVESGHPKGEILLRATALTVLCTKKSAPAK